MDVTTAEQARIGQEAGACAVMPLERIPADIHPELTTDLTVDQYFLSLVQQKAKTSIA